MRRVEVWSVLKLPFQRSGRRRRRRRRGHLGEEEVGVVGVEVTSP